MKFETRSLRVQLPCKSISLIDGDEYDAQMQAHQYWRALAADAKVKFRGCEECSANPSEPLCDNESQPDDLFAIVDIRVLPMLREQLQSRLKEIERLEEAVANALGNG